MAWREETIGDARLILGDCREVLPTLSGVDAVVTDPPYGVAFIGKKSTSQQTRSGIGYTKSADMQNDMDAVFEAIKFCIDAFPRCVITPGTRQAMNYPAPSDIGSIFIPAGQGYGRWGFTCSQPILYYGACPYNAAARGARPNSFLTTDPKTEGEDHPCPKPTSWMLWLVNRASLDGQIVLDPFMGSGTTGVACAKLGRRFIGIEIEPKYYDIACRRIEQAYKQADLFIRRESEPKPENMELSL